MACAMQDSTVKVFWLNKAKLKEHLGFGPANNTNSNTNTNAPAASTLDPSGQNPGQKIYTTEGLKVTLLADMLQNRGVSLGKAR